MNMHGNACTCRVQVREVACVPFVWADLRSFTLWYVRVEEQLEYSVSYQQYLKEGFYSWQGCSHTPPPSQREREACFSLAPPWQRPRSQTFDCSFLCCSQIFGPIEHVALGHPTCKILLVGVVNNIVSVSWVQDSRVEWKRKKYWGKGQMERTDKNLEESRSR